MKAILSLYSWRFAATLVYMLQSVEYQAWPYIKWFWRVRDFNVVSRRRQLALTGPARLLAAALYGGMLLQVMIGVGLVYGWWRFDWPTWQWGGLLIVIYPIVWSHLAVVPLWLGRLLVVKPRQRRAINQAEKIFANHSAVKVAVAGSYGKTSMKELLVTVLSGSRKVAATPANKNVSISHAAFARTLDGDEDIIILEYGEGAPGDVGRFARRTHPTHAVITGLAPAHLDHYRTYQAAARDIFSIASYVPAKHCYVNADSADTETYRNKVMPTYDGSQALDWKVSRVKVGLEGTEFTMTRGAAKPGKKAKGRSVDGKQKMTLRSGLVGRHQVGPLAFAAAFAVELGLEAQQVADGIARTVPYEHRMQPRRLSGAWIIDDTYNGNLEGVRAGTALLSELSAKRKWYVTPGLVDQGRETPRVHRQMGELIATAQPDIVVLMANSVTDFIIAGLKAGGFKGELRIEDDPLHFYANLSYFVAAGDLVLMQNDWTDNYQ